MTSKETSMSATISPVILNQTNLVPSTLNNVYRYTFPGSAGFKGSKVAVSNIQIFYSWVNISASANNNTLSMIFPTAATTATINVTIPDGTYTVADLNSFLQSIMVANGYYLVDSMGNFVYYMELVENGVRYSIQLNTFPVPTSLPVGYSNPGAWVLPTVGNTPQLVIPATNIVQLLGFAAGTYPSPAQATAYSALSATVPQLSPVSSVVVGCNLVNNKLANPRSIIYTFSPGGVTYGSLIQSNAYQYSWVDIQDGTYSSVDITFYDQNFANLAILDTNVVIFLLIKDH
jgi:hypothetical protein